MSPEAHKLIAAYYQAALNPGVRDEQSDDYSNLRPAFLALEAFITKLEEAAA